MANQMHFYKPIIDDEIVITEPEQTFDGHFIPLLRRWDKKKKKKKVCCDLPADCPYAHNCVAFIHLKGDAADFTLLLLSPLLLLFWRRDVKRLLMFFYCYFFHYLAPSETTSCFLKFYYRVKRKIFYWSFLIFGNSFRMIFFFMRLIHRPELLFPQKPSTATFQLLECALDCFSW